MAETPAAVSKRLNPNQVVAYNMGLYRRAAGMSQADLAIELETRTRFVWTKVTVSAAERSWESDRSKQFDATQLFALCDIFLVPLVALFLPPDEGGPWIIAPKVGWQKSYLESAADPPSGLPGWSSASWWRTLSGSAAGGSRAWEDYQRRRAVTEEQSSDGGPGDDGLRRALATVTALKAELERLVVAQDDQTREPLDGPPAD